MRYLLCGPVSGIEGWNEPAFAEAANYLRSRLGMTILNPLELSKDRSGPWGYYITLSTEAIYYGDVDALIFLPGWRDSLGANCEHDVAERMGMPCSDYLEIRQRAGD